MLSSLDLIPFKAFSQHTTIHKTMRKNTCDTLMQNMWVKSMITRQTDMESYILTMEIFYKANSRTGDVKEKGDGLSRMAVIMKATSKTM